MRSRIALVINLDSDFDVKFSNYSFRQIAIRFLTLKKLFGSFELDLHIISSQKMKNLNEKYLGKKSMTDVLSFPVFNKTQLKIISSKNIEAPYLLGQIIICYPQAIIQAKENNISTKEEIERLFFHGFKHILGYHHR